MKFKVKFSAAGDDINFTLWLDVDSSDAYQPSVLTRFDKDADIYRNLQHLSMPKRLPAAGKEVM